MGTATATAAEHPRGSGAGWPVLVTAHVAAAAWVVVMLWLALTEPVVYRSLLQEDRFVEWWTVGLFVAAAVVFIRHAVPRRRVFDILVALFCVFVAGEEFSWGQRLLGFTPPEVFLEHNTQQEFTVHNFADVFGKPKGVLVLALLGYGVALPLTTLHRRGRALLDRIGATPPSTGTAAWLAVAALLLIWYPVEYTGEWVEALAGGLFVVSGTRLTPAGRRARQSLSALLAAAVAAVGLSAFSARRDAGPVVIACAESEARALLEGIAWGDAGRSKLEDRSVHKRLATAADDGYLHRDLLRAALEPVQCEGVRESDPGPRRRHFVDPWGMAYWIRTTGAGPGYRGYTVYSMGPNRRRDDTGAGGEGDDVIVESVVAR